MYGSFGYAYPCKFRLVPRERHNSPFKTHLQRKTLYDTFLIYSNHRKCFLPAGKSNLKIVKWHHFGAKCTVLKQNMAQCIQTDLVLCLLLSAGA